MATAPAQTPPDEQEMTLINEQREYAIELQRQFGSWAQVAKRTNIAQGSISTFAGGKYNGGPYAGGNLKIAEKLARFRATQIRQATMDIEAPVVPGHFDCETGAKLAHLLGFAQRGKMVAAAMGPGTSKTSTAEHFCETNANAFLVTVSPSSSGVNNFLVELLEALGEKNAVGTPQKLSRRLKEIAASLEFPLFIIDEAQHLSEKAIEEIRHIHDKSQVGLALLGNLPVMQKLQGGNRASAFAQLYSRLSMKTIQALPLPADIDAQIGAWGIHDADLAEFIHQIGARPGGMRNVSNTLELATMIASSFRESLDLSHAQDAWAQLDARTVLA